MYYFGKCKFLVVYTVDLQEHKLEQIEHKDNSLYGVYTFSFGEKIIALKNERYNDTIVTYIDTYSPTIDKYYSLIILDIRLNHVLFRKV